MLSKLICKQQFDKAYVLLTAGRSTRAISLRSDRGLNRGAGGCPSIDLDTVLEERSDAEQTQVRLQLVRLHLNALLIWSYRITYTQQTDLITPDSSTELHHHHHHYQYPPAVHSAGDGSGQPPHLLVTTPGSSSGSS